MLMQGKGAGTSIYVAGVIELRGGIPQCGMGSNVENGAGQPTTGEHHMGAAIGIHRRGEGGEGQHDRALRRIKKFFCGCLKLTDEHRLQEINCRSHQLASMRRRGIQVLLATGWRHFRRTTLNASFCSLVVYDSCDCDSSEESQHISSHLIASSRTSHHIGHVTLHAHRTAPQYTAHHSYYSSVDSSGV